MPDTSRRNGLAESASGFAAALTVLLIGRFAGDLAPAPKRRTADPEPHRGTTLRQKARIAGWVILAEIIVAPIAAALFVWSGIYNVAATSEHLPVTRFVLHRAMIQSAKLHSKVLPAPALDDPRLIRRGAAHFESGCAPCHGSPLAPPSPIEIGATPPPPPLYSVAQDFTADQLHWIVKHGIKMTAMPPWPTQKRDDEVWAMVAFLEALPLLRGDDYADLIGRHQPAPADASLDRLASDSGTQSCAACHGPDGNGRNGVAPRLAGLNPDYIVSQIDDFRSGLRESGIMRPVAMSLTPEKARAIANYMSQQPRATSPVSAPQDVMAKGERIAKQIGPAPCEACHAADAQKNPVGPTLAGQDRDYMLTELRLFAAGLRNGPNALAMRNIARGLSDEDARAVTAWYASRNPSGSNVAGR